MRGSWRLLSLIYRASGGLGGRGVFLKSAAGGGKPSELRKNKTVYTLLNKGFQAKERGYVHTMASTKTTTKTIRIDNETAEYFKEKPLNRAVESLCGLLRSGTLTFDGEELKVENAPTESPKRTHPKTDLESIAEMARLMQVSTEGLLTALNEALEEGTLYYSNGKLVNPRYEEFERACGDRDIDKILNSMIRSL